MSEHQAPPRLDIRRAADSAAVLEGRCVVSRFGRLLDLLPDRAERSVVHWHARFESIDDTKGRAQAWLQLQFEVSLPMVCQRCLDTFDDQVRADRRFRFVASEAQAEAEDDSCEEDLLVTSRQFDLAQLLEDEMLMALPLLPRHLACPLELAPSEMQSEPAKTDARPNPFAALAALKQGKTH